METIQESFVGEAGGVDERIRRAPDKPGAREDIDSIIVRAPACEGREIRRGPQRRGYRVPAANAEAKKAFDHQTRSQAEDSGRTARAHDQRR